jgi:hypothetical protein
MRATSVIVLWALAGSAAADDLYVQRAGDLHLGQPDGPVIGRALPGAHLPIVKRTTAAAEVTLPGYYDLGTFEPGCCLHIGDLHAFLDARLLGPKEPQATAPHRPPGKVYRDYELTLDTPDGTSITKVRCGDLYVADQGDKHRVTQLGDGFELTGWTKQPLPWPRGRRFECPPRVVTDREAALPPGYLAPSALPSDLAQRLAALVRVKATLFVPIFDGPTTLCARFKLSKKSAKATIQARGLRFNLPYSFEVRPGPIGVYSGPVGASLTPVDITAQHLVFVANVPSLSPPVVGYHPDDTEIWYLDADTCAREATPLHASRIYPS